MDLVHELCPVQLLEVTKKSDNISGWLASIQHLARMKCCPLILIECGTSFNSRMALDLSAYNLLIDNKFGAGILWNRIKMSQFFKSWRLNPFNILAPSAASLPTLNQHVQQTVLIRAAFIKKLAILANLGMTSPPLRLGKYIYFF